jgi:hypothetical protein
MRMSMDFAEGDRCDAEATETAQATAVKTRDTMVDAHQQTNTKLLLPAKSELDRKDTRS